nr:hypothetical protein [Tanacetum cinerariifolium]
MGKPLSPDRVFDFPMDEPEPQHAYDFFAPGPLPGYAGNPNNMNGWIEADVPLLGELGEMGEPLRAEVDEPLVDPMIDELAKPIVKVEEQMVTSVMDMEDDLAMLFGVITVSDAEVADGIAIREIGPRVSTVKGQIQVMAFQMVQQPMAVKKTSFLETESSGSIVVNIPGSSRIRIRGHEYSEIVFATGGALLNETERATYILVLD